MNMLEKRKITARREMKCLMSSDNNINMAY